MVPCILNYDTAFRGDCCILQALAILHQKPEGVSALEFTERLSLQFSRAQTNWKGRVEQLERELLRTRQELMKCQIHSEISTTNPFSRDPPNTYPPPHDAATNFMFNPPCPFPSDNIVNPSCSQQSHLPQSQLQLDSVLHHHSQLLECSSSHDSEGEWPSSGYCLSLIHI